MIIIKSKREIELMKEPCKVTAELLDDLAGFIRPGISTMDISEFVEKRITGHGMTPTFKGYGGFPAAAGVSVNEEVIHGIPSDRELKNGDIVKVDVGAFYKGYHGDCACTYIVGSTSPEAEQLVKVTKESFFKAIELAVPGNRIGDISHAVEQHVIPYGYSVVRDFVGHGIGTALHEDPEVPNFGKAGRGPRLCEGMTLAIEPMINMGTHLVKTLSNNWTVVTIDGKLSSHYENTIAITENGPVILTDEN